MSAFVLLLLVVMHPAAAQEIKTPPKAFDPQAVRVASDDPAAKPEWTLVKKSGQARLWRDLGLGTVADPRRYYVTWTETTDVQGVMKSGGPLLVFMEPGNADRVEFPKEQVYLTDKPLQWPPQREGLQTDQAWKFPQKPTAHKGLFAGSPFMPSATITWLKPLVWWGLTMGQEVDEIAPEKLHKATEVLFAESPKTSGAR